MPDKPQLFAVVTGCSPGGLGAEFAKQLVDAGYTVFATGRTPSKLAPLASTCDIVQLDVTDPESIKKAQAQIESKSGGRLHLLINNAGVMHDACPALDMSIDELEKGYATNVFGPMRVAQAFGPMLVRTAQTEKVYAGVHLVNIGSVVGVGHPMPWLSSYSSSKAAVNVWSRSLALELAPLGVLVTTATPGLIKTNMTANEGSKPAELPEASFYRKSWGGLLKKLGTILDSTKSNIPPADQFVEGLLAQVLRSNSPRQTWGGGAAGAFRYAIPMLPAAMQDKAIASTFGIPRKI